jgi:diguanylate cyclase (GGDEF)-like protein
MDFVTPRLPRSTEQPQRLEVLRALAELLSSDEPVAGRWALIAEPIAEMLEAERVVIALRDVETNGERIVFDSQVAIELPESEVPEGSLARAVLERGETIARSEGGSVAAGAPIRFGNAVLGAIVLYRVHADLTQLPLLESSALYLGSRIQSEGALQATRQFARLALIDGLTGVANRRKFDDALEAEWSRARREGTCLAVVMIDIDYFKSFNDNYGHQAGDLCLQQVARALAECMQRPADLFARYGGEEFVALLPSTDIAGATALAERLRGALARIRVSHSGSSLGYVTLSAGVAAAYVGADATALDLVAKADAALYDAKIAGRNRVVTNDYVSHTQPAERVAGALRRNLPVPLAPLVGRHREVAEIRALAGGHRLVTVVGVGGIGKTRVTLHVARDLAADMPDGAWFVDLAAIEDPALVIRAFAGMFGEASRSVVASTDALVRKLASKNALIVVDNCEHLLEEAASVIRAIVHGAPGVRVIATSREPLGIIGEARYRLPLLSLPPAGRELRAVDALRADAVALFTERARAVRPNFSIDDANATLVATIVRRLDGIALAIELAAARVDGTGLETLAARLDQRFRLLTGGENGALPRQRTMRATLDWSFDLLSDVERAVFRRLAIFAGAFSLDAAVATCAGDGVSAADITDVVAILMRKSLVADDGNDVTPYVLLESMRAYGREKLADAGETDVVARRHAAFYADLADRAVEAYNSMPTHDWLATAERHRPNYRAALEWTLRVRNDPVLGGRLAAALIASLGDRESDEGIQWVEEALAQIEPDAHPSIEAHLSLRLANSGHALAADRMRSAAERAVTLYRTLDEPARQSHAVRILAQILYWYFPRERDLAKSLAEEAIEIARSGGDQLSIAYALKTLALMLDLSDIEGKRELMEESLALSRRFGNDQQIGSVLSWMSEMEFVAGEDVVRALGYGRAALRYAETSGSRMRLEISAANLAIYAAGAGDWPMAIATATRALRLSVESRSASGLTWAIQALACAAAGLEDYPRAARLLAFCDARCGTLHSPRQADQCEEVSARRLRVRLAAALAPADLGRELQAGSELTEDEAIGEALTLER